MYTPSVGVDARVEHPFTEWPRGVGRPNPQLGRVRVRYTRCNQILKLLPSVEEEARDAVRETESLP